jgi:hypothetical protein
MKDRSIKATLQAHRYQPLHSCRGTQQTSCTITLGLHKHQNVANLLSMFAVPLGGSLYFSLSSIHIWVGKYTRGKESRNERGRWETLMDVGSTEVPQPLS